VLRGIPVAPGIAVGPARRPGARPLPEVDERPAGDPAAERARLDAARAAAAEDVRAARDRVAERAGLAEAAIFEAHLALLDDAALVQPAHEAIAAGRSAAAAWREAVQAAAASFRALDDPYLRERAADVDDVGARVLAHLAGGPAPAFPAAPGVLVAADLAPGQAAQLDRDVVQAIALAHGGATSHAAILARALGIPAVVGLGDAALGIADGTTVVLDGTAGTLAVDPGEAALAELEERRRAEDERRARARAHAHEPARTRDGVTIEVAANIGAPADAADAVALGADGVGLLRTEFLFLDRDDPPTEAEQQAVLSEIARTLDGRPLIVRTLDAGADKPLPYLRQPPEDNPFLGVRGIRLGLKRPELLRTQARAILRTAIDYPLRVMLPMVATAAEYRAARALFEEVRAEVGAPPVELGVMVEVPALALMAGRVAAEADFFSIGTNDLAQYTMAAERGNDAVAELLRGVQPAVLRLVAAVTQAAEAHGRWTGVCGELAGDPGAAVLLVGLGVRELSMAPPRIPEVKQALRTVSVADARELARRALELDDAAAVADLIATAGA
jgi:phosphocarrier protein FPr